MKINDRLRSASIALTLIGLLDAIYLTWVKLGEQEIFCANIGDCDAVNTSAYSEIAGIPVALLGVGGYLLILLVLLFEDRIASLIDNGPLMLFGLTLVGVLFSAYLTYIEIAVIKAICPYCVLSAICLLILLILAIIRLNQVPEMDA